MMYVAGVDPATKNLAVSTSLGACVTLNARAGAKDPVRRLHELEREFLGAFRHHPPMPDVFVVEGYALSAPGRLALVRLGEVGGMVRTNVFRLGAEIVEVQPSALKRAATGNGQASKAAMIARALELGARLSRPVVGDEKKDPHDEADAFLARRLGRIAYGLETCPATATELEVVAALKWPRIAP